MARHSVTTADGQELSFFVPDNGGNVYLEHGRKHGTLGRQLCQHGGYRGNALTATPETLAAVATKWCRDRGAL